MVKITLNMFKNVMALHTASAALSWLCRLQLVHLRLRVPAVGRRGAAEVTTWAPDYLAGLPRTRFEAWDVSVNLPKPALPI